MHRRTAADTRPGLETVPAIGAHRDRRSGPSTDLSAMLEVPFWLAPTPGMVTPRTLPSTNELLPRAPVLAHNRSTCKLLGTPNTAGTRQVVMVLEVHAHDKARSRYMAFLCTAVGLYLCQF